MMMFRCLRQPGTGRRGTALFVALAVVAVLLTLALGLNRKVQLAAEAAAAEADRTALYQAAVGAIHAAMALLVEDKRIGEADHLYETWADPEQLVQLAAQGAADGIVLSLHVTDERSKIQVNALVDFPAGQQANPIQQALWERFLALPAFDDLRGTEQPPAMIVSAVKDWLDRGDDDAITGLGGAEAAHYAALPIPYGCRNGPMPDTSELALVAGMPPALFAGKDDQPGITPYVTAYGRVTDGPEAGAYNGRININTAALPVLTALLPEEHQDLAQAIYDYRQDAETLDNHDLFADPGWYRNAPGCQSLTIDPGLITTASDLFRIQVRADRAGVPLTLFAVVERYQDTDSGQTRIRILSWQPS